VVHHFPQRLSCVIAEVEDDAIRSVLAKQLNDELGEGDFSKAHKGLYRNLLDALAPWRLEGDEELLLAPGREFSRRIGDLLFGGSSWEAIGALMLIEIYGKHTDIRLGQEFRRQNALDPKALTWLHLHEELEVDHAEDSLTLARLVPASDEALAAAWRGARGIDEAAQNYFNMIYKICYPNGLRA
jgi:hypothetical protein